MTDFMPAPMITAVNRLMLDVAVLAGDDEVALEPLTFERFARAISAGLTALRAVEDYNLQAAQKQTKEKYTRYEDLPPPSPEEQDRFYARLESVIGKIEAGDALPDPHRPSESEF